MTPRIFSPRGNQDIFSTFWGDFLTKLHKTLGEKEEKIRRRKKKTAETAPRNCRFLSLVLGERALILAWPPLFNSQVESQSAPPSPRTSHLFPLALNSRRKIRYVHQALPIPWATKIVSQTLLGIIHCELICQSPVLR